MDAPSGARPDPPPSLSDLFRFPDPDPVGSASTNAGAFSLLRLLEAPMPGPDAPAELFERWRSTADPELAELYRRQLERGIESLRVAERHQIATYGLPRWAPPSSLDTGATSPHLTGEDPDRDSRKDRDELKARMARTLEAVPAADPWLEELGRRRDGTTYSRLSWLRTKASSLEACRIALAFREQTCGTYLVRPSSCRVRGCPDCERARAARVVNHYAAAAERMRWPAIVTVTEVNTPATLEGLEAGLERLAAGWEKVRRRAVFRGGRCKSWRTRHAEAIAKHGWRRHHPVAGGLSSVEVTVDEEGATFHPHLHALVDSRWIDQAELSDAWREVMGDGSYIVDIRRVRGNGQELRDVLREVLKYVAKPSRHLVDPERPELLAALLVALHRRRMIAGFGSMYGLELDPDSDAGDDTVAVDDSWDPFIVHSLPRDCPYCGADAAWEPPIRVPRVEAFRAPRAGPGRPPPLAWQDPAPA